VEIVGMLAVSVTPRGDGVDRRGGGRPSGGHLDRRLVRVIETADAPSHTGPVPQAVVAGGWTYVSALFGADPTTHAIPADARAEAEQLFANLTAILAAADAGLTDVVRVGIVMRALQRDRPVFNEVWAQRFGAHRPARSAIEASDFGRTGENARYMIEVVAFRG
jgi:2-iminobutanoate/2-iminopropanoate deaminase